MRATSPVAFVASCILLGCARHTPPPKLPTSDAGWSYEVSTSDGDDLDVTAAFPPGSDTALALDESSSRYVRDFAVLDGATWRTVARDRDGWLVERCARGCTVRYRFSLGDAADAIDDVDLATRYEGAIEAPPSTWLLRPRRATRGRRYRFHVTTTNGTAFVTGVSPVANREATYEADQTDLELAPYSVFGRLTTRTIVSDGARIDVARLPGALALDDAAFERWIRISEGAVHRFYRRFPVKRVALLLVPSSGKDVHGKTLASGGASILLDVGGRMNASDVDDDWVLTHEMIHLAFPSLPRRYAWLEEGLATYVEPIARARVGTIGADEVWRGLVRGLPNGEPENGDRGLDRTPTWGRTYWGGALFCLMADIEIRERTHGAKSLEDALRGILEAGGNGEVRWTIDRALAAGDAAVGVPVLTEMHAHWGTTPVHVDLPRLWARLGVLSDGRGIAFDDQAPGAALRRAIAGERAASRSD